MKFSLMIGGLALIICAIMGHNYAPNIISQVNETPSLFGGSMICGTYAENNCLALSFTETTFEFSTIGLGLIGIMLVGYGGLINNRKIGNLELVKSENPTIKVLEDLFS